MPDINLTINESGVAVLKIPSTATQVPLEQIERINTAEATVAGYEGRVSYLEALPSAVPSVGKVVKWEGLPWVDVREAGVSLTDFNDYSSEVSTLIAQVSAAGGGTILVPDGTLVANFKMLSGVALVSMSRMHAGPTTDKNRTRLQAASGGVHIDTSLTENTEGMLIEGFQLVGLGAATPLDCIVVRGGKKNFIRGCSILSYAGRAIHQPAFGTEGSTTTVNGTLSISSLFAQNCLLGGVVAPTGVINLLGTDGRLDWVEATGSLSSLSSANKYLRAIRVAGADWSGSHLLGEFADIGIDISGERNRFTLVKSDYSFAEGFLISGSDNKLVVPYSHRAGQQEDNTYDGFSLSGVRNTLVCPEVNSRDSAVNRVRYGISETLSNSTIPSKNKIIEPIISDYGTAPYHSSSLFGGSPISVSPSTHVEIADGDTTPSLAGGNFLIYTLTSLLTIISIDDATPGIEICILSISNNKLTIQHGFNFFNLSGLDLTMASNTVAKYKNYNGKWYQI